MSGQTATTPADRQADSGHTATAEHLHADLSARIPTQRTPEQADSAGQTGNAGQEVGVHMTGQAGTPRHATGQADSRTADSRTADSTNTAPDTDGQADSGEPLLGLIASWTVLIASFGLSASTWIDLARLAGFTEKFPITDQFKASLAWLMPLAVDGYVVVALVLWMSPVPPKVAAFAKKNTYAAAGFGIAAQSAYHSLNAMGGVDVKPWQIAMAAIVGSLPPAVAGLAVHMRALIRREAGRVLEAVQVLAGQAADSMQAFLPPTVQADSDPSIQTAQTAGHLPTIPAVQADSQPTRTADSGHAAPVGDMQTAPAVQMPAVQAVTPPADMQMPAEQTADRVPAPVAAPGQTAPAMQADSQAAPKPTTPATDTRPADTEQGTLIDLSARKQTAPADPNMPSIEELAKALDKRYPGEVIGRPKALEHLKKVYGKCSGDRATEAKNLHNAGCVTGPTIEPDSIPELADATV